MSVKRSWASSKGTSAGYHRDGAGDRWVGPAFSKLFEGSCTVPAYRAPSWVPTPSATLGTEYCRLGGNVRALQAIMGHERLDTTMRYVHLAGQAIAEDHAKSSPFTNLVLGRRPSDSASDHRTGPPMSDPYPTRPPASTSGRSVRSDSRG